MKAKQQPDDDQDLIETWALPYAATLGSSVRVKGIFLEVRAGLPLAIRKSLRIAAGGLALRMSQDAGDEFRATSKTIEKKLEGIESLSLLPREIQDIVSISATERHRWLKDGRLPSAGTRTVKLRGRARQVTFHVFDPRIVEDILDQDLVALWREQDAETAADNRRRAAWKSKLTRSKQSAERQASTSAKAGAKPGLRGWDEFERDGPLRRRKA